MNACSCGGGTALSGNQAAYAALQRFFGRDREGHVGTCPKGVIEYCETLWTTAPIELASGASGTLTFDTNGANVYFDEFASVGMILTVTARGRNSALDSAGAYTQTVDECCLDELIQIDAVRFKGNNRLPSKQPINLGLLRCCNLVLGTACFGVMKVSGQSVTVDVTNVADPTAVTFDLQIQAALAGWEVRDGNLMCAGECHPCNGEGTLMPKLPPGSSGSAEFRIKANVGTTPGSGYRPEP